MDNKVNKERETQLITRLRAAAVFLIVLAHSNNIPVNSPPTAAKIMELCSSISFFGVWVFFSIGGYLLAYEKRPLLSVLKRKIETIIIPWIFTGTLVYLYTFFRHGEISFITFIKFVMGYGSYLWYMPVYCVLVTLFLCFRAYKCFPMIAVGLSLFCSITRVLYSFVGGGQYELWYFLSGWPVAFGCGYLVNYLKLQVKLKEIVLQHSKVWSVGAIILPGIVFVISGRWYYWSKCYIWLSIVVFPGIICISNSIGNRFGKRMEQIGKDSFSIYLIHMPIVGIVNNLMCRMDRGFSVAFRPILVLGITEAVISVILYVAKRVRCEKIASCVLGRR